MKRETMELRNGKRIELDTEVVVNGEIIVDKWICDEKKNSFETVSILTTALVGCPIIVHDEEGDTIVGTVTDSRWDSKLRLYRTKVLIDSLRGIDGFSKHGNVEMLWDEKLKYCVPYALAVKRK